MAFSMGVALTGLLFLVTQNPWGSVFACCAGLGWLLIDYGLTAEALRVQQEAGTELEKQIVVLRTALHEMAMANSELEASVRLSCPRPKWRRQLSSSSL